MDAIEALKTRRSVRKYQTLPIGKEQLETIVDAGRLAATARNEQPWEFVVVTEPQLKRRIAEATDHGKFLAEAAAVIAVFCRESKYYLEDGIASP
jgi:nitroreductase